MHETLRQRQAAADLAEQRVLRHEHVGEADARMVGRHVEGPHVLLDLHAMALGRHQEAGDAAGIAVIARGAREQRAMRGDVHAGRPHLLAVDDPALDVVAGRRHRARLHVRRVGAVIRLGQAKGDAVLALDRAVDHRLLVVAAVAVEHGDDGQIADDRMLVLQIVVQAEALRRQNARGSRPSRGWSRPCRHIASASQSADGRRRRRDPWPCAAALPIHAAAGRHSRNRCAPIRGDGRRSGCCRRPASSGLISRSMKRSSSSEIGDEIGRQ